jgi:hypothetical protein
MPNFARISMQLREEQLRQKGWSEEEISHAKGIFVKAKENRSFKHKLIEQITYWILLILLIGGSYAGLYTSIPFLLILGTGGSIVVLAILGLLYGVLAVILINDLEHLQTHHHISLGFIIPISAIIVSLILFGQLSTVAAQAEIPVHTTQIIVSVVYTISSIVPLIGFHLMRKKQ